MNSAKNVPFSLYRLIPVPALIGPDEGRGELLEELHEGLVSVMVVLLLVHVAAALWHHFLKKDRVLLRMLRSERS
jgi:cytochrome b561